MVCPRLSGCISLHEVYHLVKVLLFCAILSMALAPRNKWLHRPSAPSEIHPRHWNSTPNRQHETASDFDVSWFPPKKNNWQSSVILTLHSGYLMIFEDAQNALNNQPRHVMVVMDDMNLSPNEFTTVHHQTTQPSYAKLHNQDQPGDFLTTQRVVKNRRWLFTRRSSRTSWFFN